MQFRLAISATLLWVISLIATGRAQDLQKSDGGVTGSTTASASQSPLRATLLLVKRNWLSGDKPEEVRKEVEAALAGKSIPSRLQENPAQLAADIWFVEDYATIYSPEDFAALVAWLHQHRLVDGLHHGEPQDPAKNLTNPILRGAVPDQSFCKISIPESVLPVPASVREAEVPFVHPQHEWFWLVIARPLHNPDAKSEMLRLESGVITREIFLKDGEEKTVSEEQRGMGGLDTELPHGQFAVVSWYLKDNFAQTPFGTRPEYSPIVVIYRAPEPCAWFEPGAAGITPALKLPAQLIPISNRSRSSYAELDQRRRSAAAGFSSGGSNRASSARTDQRLLQTFQLKYAAVKNVLNALQPFFQDRADVKMSADERSNTLIVQAADNDQQVIKTLLQTIDVASADDDQPQPEPQQLENIRQDYQRLESRLIEMRQNRNQRLEENDPQMLRLREQLRETVSQLFAARQELQRAEIAALRKKLTELEQAVQMREQLKEQIIDGRVQQLLEVD